MPLPRGILGRAALSADYGLVFHATGLLKAGRNSANFVVYCLAPLQDPDKSNWPEYPNIDYEVGNLMDDPN